jgi:hypothetical protein
MNSRKTTCYPRPHRDHRRIDTATFPDIRTQSPLDHHLYPLSFVHDRSQEDPLTIQPRHPTNGVFRYRWSVGGVVREVLDNWLALRGETAVQHSFILCVILHLERRFTKYPISRTDPDPELYRRMKDGDKILQMRAPSEFTLNSKSMTARYPQYSDLFGYAVSCGISGIPGPSMYPLARLY